MSEFENQDSKQGFSTKLWRGERTCLLGFDVAAPEPDFVGFAIECRSPGAAGFVPLLNRITFPGGTAVLGGVTGARKFPSTESPFQKFRWVHFPHDPQPGAYTYRATKMHMRSRSTQERYRDPARHSARPGDLPQFPRCRVHPELRLVPGVSRQVQRRTGHQRSREEDHPGLGR